MRLAVISHPCVTALNQDFYARVQARSGWDVAIVLPNRWRNEYGAARLERWPGFAGDLLPTRVLLPGNIPLHVYAASLVRRLGALRPEALYVHHEPYAAATFQAARAARRLGVPFGFYSAQNLRKTYPWPARAWERAVHARASFALPVSEAVAGVLRAKGYAGELQVLPLGVDTERYAPAPDPPALAAAGPLRIGYVGRLADEKGVDTLIDAIALLQAPARAIVVGDGPAREQLARRAAGRGVAERIEWRGYVVHEAAPSAYRGMDVVVVPSRTIPTWTEQFGRVVIEALACAVPVIASDSGELPRLIADTGGGWTVPEDDAGALARAIDRVAADPEGARRLAVAGRAAVLARYDADVIADRFIEVVEGALARR